MLGHQHPSSPIAPHSCTPTEVHRLVLAGRAGTADLVYRDPEGELVIRALAADCTLLTLGRADDRDIKLWWDPEVSRAHAKLEAIGLDWTLVDDGSSTNGSFVNGERVHGRRGLKDRDLIVLGRTAIAFRSPHRSHGATTRMADRTSASVLLTEADRRLLVALCRPLKDPRQRVPATNRAIADELCVSVSAVKKRLGELFVRFGLDRLPQNEKRTQLAAVAIDSGVPVDPDG